MSTVELLVSVEILKTGDIFVVGGFLTNKFPIVNVITVDLAGAVARKFEIVIVLVEDSAQHV